MTKLAVLLCAALACAAAPSFAADEATPGACKADYQKFCKDVKPGGGRIMACFKEHQADLSDACKTKIAAAKEKAKENKDEFKQVCGADVKALCGGVKPGHGAIMKCMRDNQAKASEDCKKFLAAKKEERMERREKWKEKRGAAKGGDEGVSEPADDGAGE